MLRKVLVESGAGADVDAATSEWYMSTLLVLESQARLSFSLLRAEGSAESL